MPPTEGTAEKRNAEVNKPTRPGGRNPWMDLKERIHRSLVEEMDLKKSDSNDPNAQSVLRAKTQKLVVELLSKEDT